MYSVMYLWKLICYSVEHILQGNISSFSEGIKREKLWIHIIAPGDVRRMLTSNTEPKRVNVYVYNSLTKQIIFTIV
jgi:hypothetical protein